MKLYQLENGIVLNLDEICAIENTYDDDQWRVVMSSGDAYPLSPDDARNLMDKDLLDFEFMAE